MSELHDVVKLLLARMESHPEEFERGTSRWAWMVEGVMTNCSEEERAALHAGLRPIRLKQLHEDVMDELLNGEERRRREIEEIEYEKRTIAQARNTLIGQSQLRVTSVSEDMNPYKNTGFGATLKKALGL